ncbi:MAG: DUF3800 domain-containing protein, partial [Blastocatellia bacterium]
EEFHFNIREIKGRDIEQGKEFFGNISPQVRRDFARRLFQLLFMHDLQVVSVVFAKKEEGIQRLNLSGEGIYEIAYKELLEHIEGFLDTKDESGLLLIDSRASSIRSHLKDDRLIAVHEDYLKKLDRGGKQSRIIEYPVFVQSEFFAAVQLADLCAYNIFRALQLRYGFQDAGAVTEVPQPFPAISHEEFNRREFIETLFSHPEIDLPALARLLTQKGKIVKLP